MPILTQKSLRNEAITLPNVNSLSIGSNSDKKPLQKIVASFGYFFAQTQRNNHFKDLFLIVFFAQLEFPIASANWYLKCNHRFKLGQWLAH